MAGSEIATITARKLGQPFWRVEWRHGDRDVVGGETFVFDANYAQRAIDFIEAFCTFTQGAKAGKPFKLEEWQRRLVWSLFGWRRADGGRRFTKLFLYIPRKNGKTEFAAAIALYFLVADGDRTAKVYCAAGSEEQAAETFEAAKQMARGSTHLRKRIQCFIKRLWVRGTRARLQVLTSKADTKHGLNCSCAVVDELHVHKNGTLLEALTTSMGARSEPMTVMTTTAPAGRDGVCFSEYKYAKDVASGEIEDATCLPVIFEADPDDDWMAEATWRKANPNLGVSVRLDWLRQQCLKAQRLPREENSFKRLHLNIITEQVTRWIPMHTWRKLSGTPRGPEWWASLRGRKCYAGVDLSSTRDLTAAALVFPSDDGLWFDAIMRYWMPAKNVAERVRQDRVKYDEWIADGWIDETEGSATDHDAIVKGIRNWAARYKLLEVAVDRWEATHVINELTGSGITAFAHGQGFAGMSVPCKSLERCVLNAQIGHGDHPVLEWNMSNVAIQTDPHENIKIVKKSPTARVDGVVALVMALGRAVANAGGHAGRSAYDRPEKEIAIIRRRR